MKNTDESLNIKYSSQIYELLNRDATRSLGILVLESMSKISNIEVGEISRTKGKFEVKTYCFPKHWLGQCYSNDFSAGYKREEGERTASISSQDVSRNGGLYVDPSEIQGLRIGGLMMDSSITWLKQFPEDTLVRKIDYKPNNELLARKFYKKFNIPLDNDTIIGGLSNSDSWLENIRPIEVGNFIFETWLNLEKLKLYEKANRQMQALLRKKQHEQYTYKNIFFGGRKIKLDVSFVNQEVQPNKDYKRFYNMMDFRCENGKYNLDKLKIFIHQYLDGKLKLEQQIYAYENLIESVKEMNTKIVRVMRMDDLFQKIRYSPNVNFLVIIVIIGLFMFGSYYINIL